MSTPHPPAFTCGALSAMKLFSLVRRNRHYLSGTVQRPTRQEERL
jgi:hypothetical protein